MSTHDSRGEMLRTFDQHANELNGRVGSKQANLTLLWQLASALSDNLHTWNEIISRLDMEFVPVLDCERAGRLIIESAFDDIFDAPVCRVLAAAFALHF